MKRQVFVSYTQADKTIAFGLVDFLEKNNILCYIAPRDIIGGRNYASEITDFIKGCNQVLLIASKDINNSDHVLNEITLITDEKKKLIPIFTEDFELSSEFKYYLGRQQRIIAYPERFNTYYNKILDTVMANLPKCTFSPVTFAPEPEETVMPNVKKSTVFEYYPGRGVMINPEDHQRNVSFRTDTFINLMGGIFDEVEKLSDNSEAQRIFFNSGYTSGKNFAERIESQWNDGTSFEDIKMKFEKWCKFDSTVGWGHFSADIYLDEAKDCIYGTIHINEAFIVDTRNKRKICSFIKGYCDGVVETFLNSCEIELTCRECPMNSRFKTKCVFDFKTK